MMNWAAMTLVLPKKMKFQVGDLVERKGHPSLLGTVIMTATTKTGAEVCKVVVVRNHAFPEIVGHQIYLNQHCWKKLTVPSAALDRAIEGKEAEYEEIIQLHHTYGES
tara:strand:- start:153 stop:476 length:324 start_codon:yes stop_codon:yes gene_type:complete